MRVRMGMHTGEPSLSDEGYHGLGVHRAARISALGHGGQVLLSGATRAVVADELDGALALRDLGEHRLKDFDEPERIFEVRYPGAPEASPPLKSFAAQPADLPFARRFARARPRRGVARRPCAASPVLAAAALVLALATSGDPTASRPRHGGGALRRRPRARGGDPRAARRPAGIAVGEGSIWVSNTDEGTVSRIDGERRAVVQRIPVGNGPAGIAVGGGLRVGGRLARRDGVAHRPPRCSGGKREQKIRVGNQPTGVAVGHGAVWVANVADKTLSRIDPQTGRAENGRSTPATAPTCWPSARSGVWVASRATDTVTQLDPRTGSECSASTSDTGRRRWRSRPRRRGSPPSSTARCPALDPEQSSERSDRRSAPRRAASRPTDARLGDRRDGRLTEVDATSGRPERRCAWAAGSATWRRAAARLRRGAGFGRRPPRRDARARGRGRRPHGWTPGWPMRRPSGALLSVTGDGLLGYRRVGGTAGNELVPDLAERCRP